MANARALVARLRVDSSDFRSEMTRSRSHAITELRAISQAATQTFKQLDSTMAGGAVSTSLRVISAVRAIQIAVNAMSIAVAATAAAGAAELYRFAEIAEKARGADVGTTFFQSWTRGADQFGQRIKDLDKDIQNLGRNVRDRFDGSRVGDVANKARDLLGERFLGTNDFGLSNAPQLFDRARNTEERIRAVMVGLRDMETAGQRLAAIDLARQLGMDRLAEQVELNRATFARFHDEAERVAQTGVRDGSLVSPELITRSEELTRRFADAGRELSNNVRPILDECARLALALGHGAAWTAEQFAALVGVLGSVVSALRNANVQANALQGAASRVQSIAAAAPADPNDGAAMSQQAREVAGRGFQRGTTGQSDRLRAEDTAETNRESSRARGLGDLEARVSPATFSAPVPARRPLDAPSATTPGRSSGKAETDQWADAYEKLVQNMERASGALRAELATVGLSTSEREKALAVARLEAEARRTGGTLTDEQRQKVAALAAEQGRLKDAVQAARQAQQGFNDALRFGGTTTSGFLSDIIAGGQSAERALENLKKKLIDAALQAAIMGEGPLAQILGFKGQNGQIGGLFGFLMGYGSQQRSGLNVLASPAVIGGAGGNATDPNAYSQGIMSGLAAASQQTTDLFTRSFGTVAANTQGEFGNVFTGLGGLLNLVLTQAIMQTRASGAGGGLGGLIGGIMSLFAGGTTVPADLYHTGGVVGAGSSRLVSAAAWSSAPRYHSGLRTGEVRAILEQGERVLTQRDSNSMFRVYGGLAKAAQTPVMGGTKVNVVNNGPTRAETTTGPDGSIEVLIPALENRLASRMGRREGTFHTAASITTGGRGNGGLRG